jgi:serine/threonine protein phosphatase PrpC
VVRRARTRVGSSTEKTTEMAQTKANWIDCLEYAALSDIGMRRANNQDSHNIVVASGEEDWLRVGHLFMVADGMGAHAAGELASKLAVDGVPHHYLKYRELSAPEALQKALLETNAEVHRRGMANAEFHNMGTTASVLVLLPQGAMVAHIGDSRVYRLRDNCLEQLTFDHSLVWEMRAAGQLPEDSDLAAAIPKNVITRSLGPNATVAVDVEGPFPLQVGDTFLLCSDGLTGEVPDEELGPILASLPPQEAAQVLVNLANLRGGPDNVTVIIAKVTGPRLATNDSSAEPIRIGQTSSKPVVHPANWIVMSVFFLAAITMLVAAHPIPALIAALGGVAALGVIAWKLYRPRGGGVSLSNGRRLGKGPYTNTICPASKSFLKKLSSIVSELREAAIEREWTVDWETFDSHCQRAERATQDGVSGEAVGEYARAISFIMQELRNQNARKASDSAIDY